jgi:hypothetical protein
MKYALSFNDFIFESFGQDRLDFCLDVLREYRKKGKGMEDLPDDIQKCLKSNGQTDFSRAIDSVYDEYTDNGNSFDGIKNPVEMIEMAGGIDRFSRRLESMPSQEPTLKKVSNEIDFLSTLLMRYGKSIQFSVVPDEGYSQYGANNIAVVSGRKVTIDKLYDDLIEILGEERLTYIGGEEYYSEIAFYLSDAEVQQLAERLGGQF